MKKVIIAGKDSYIGSNLKRWLEQTKKDYAVEEVGTREDIWKTKDFSDYDVVVHVAGIAHVSSDPKLESLYYAVNRDLALDVAKKAKQEGVKQFIFMSSMTIYGKDSTIGKEKLIDKDTIPKATDFYVLYCIAIHPKKFFPPDNSKPANDTNIQPADIGIDEEEPIDNTGLTKTPYGDGYYTICSGGRYSYAPNVTATLSRKYTTQNLGLTKYYKFSDGDTLSQINVRIFSRFSNKIIDISP